MVRADNSKFNQQLPSGFDDQSSQGGAFKRTQIIDDMSSQGSYMVRAVDKVRGGNVNTFDDMTSQGSYMVRGYNGGANGAALFNADDDQSEGVEILRQSNNMSERSGSFNMSS